MSTQYFGAPGDAPAYEHAVRVPVPVGKSCYACDEPILDGDRGWVRPYGVTLGPDGATVIGDDPRPIHRECALLDVIGHMVGVCPCSPEWRDRPVREQAREAGARWARVTAG